MSEALGCHSYQRYELMLEKTVELLEKSELHNLEFCVMFEETNPSF